MSVTTLAPGKRAEVMIAPSMHEGMDGPHLFEVTIETDSTTRPVQKLYLRANWKK